MNMDWIQQIIVQSYTYGGGVCAGVVVSALNFRSEGWWFEAVRAITFNKPNSTNLSLSTQVYKGVPVTYCWG